MPTFRMILRNQRIGVKAEFKRHLPGVVEFTCELWDRDGHPLNWELTEDEAARVGSALTSAGSPHADPNRVYGYPTVTKYAVYVQRGTIDTVYNVPVSERLPNPETWLSVGDLFPDEHEARKWAAGYGVSPGEYQIRPLDVLTSSTED